MTTPEYRTACHPTAPAGRAEALPAHDRFAIPRLLLLIAALSAVALPAFAQDQPVFRVPVLEDVDPDSVDFNDRIIERDRTQPGMGEPVQAPNPNEQGASAGGGGGAGGGSSGGYGRAPSVFQGGPQMPTPSSSDSGDGGIDVNVSVSGQQLPSILQGDSGGAGTPGMPGSPGVPGMPGTPGSTGSSSGSAGGSSDSDGDGDGDLDVNVNVTGGPQLPSLRSPGLPGSEGSSGAGMPGSMPGATPGMPGMPGSSSGSSSGTGSSSGDGSMAGSSSGNGGNGSMPGSMPGAGGSSGNGTMAGAGSAGGSSSGTGTIGGGTGRAAVLDRRLEESFGVFDGMIIAEREKAQSEADAAGSDVMGTGAGGEGDGAGEGGAGEEGGTFGGAPEGTILVAGGPGSGTGGGVLPAGAEASQDQASAEQPTFPVPEDIPSGDDDDVVARQLREAAMSEPDPELREKLWDEYRKYTGLSQ